MKTTLKNIVAILIMALLPALTGAAQAGAVNYKSTYRGIQSQPVYGIATTATAPTATFQSTSVYSEQWTADQSSMLNADGSVNAEVYMSGPNRATKGGPGGGASGPGTPGGDLDPQVQQPLGDGLWALMLCACVYAVYTVARRRKKA